MILGNLHLLQENLDQAKDSFRKAIVRATNDPSQMMLEGMLLNNLAFASWIHVLGLKDVQDESVKQRILTEERGSLGYLKSAIKMIEEAQVKHDDGLLEQLLSADFDADESATTTETEAQLSGVLQGQHLGIAITNLCEYQLMTQALRGELKNSSFWFNIGLKYYERCCPDTMDRHLTMLGLFCGINGKNMMSEGLYRRVLENHDYGKPTLRKTNTLGMALSFYANMLTETNPNRKTEADEYRSNSAAV